MEKIKYILLTIFLFFTIDVSALTIENDSYLKYVDIRSNTDYSSNITGNANYDSGTVYFTCDYIANSYGCGVQFRTKEELDLIRGRSYTFSLDIGVTGARLVKSTADKGEYFGLKALATPPNYLSAYDYWFNTDINNLPYKIDNVGIQYIDDSSQIITFSFTMLENVSDASIFFFPFSLNKTGIYASTIFELNYLAIDSTNDDIINSLEEQSQEIIKNQNENNEKVLNAIDRVNESFNTCRDSYNLIKSEFLQSTTNTDINASLKSGTYTLSLENNVNFNGVIYIQLYKNGNLITTNGHLLNTSSAISFSTSSYWYYFSNMPNGKFLTFTIDDDYDLKIALSNPTGTQRPMLNAGSSVKPFEAFNEKVCTNKIDDLNENITSPNVPNQSELATKLDTTGWLKPGPVDSIINMPLNLINNLLSSLNNNTCSQLVIDIPYLKNKQLIIPCISTLYERMGLSSLFNSIGVVASAFILFRYLVGFYKWVDDTLSFREQNWGDF